MKKNYIFTVLFFLITILTVKAQLLTEDFSSAVPPTGWTIDAHAGNWIQSGSNQAGGTAPEAVMKWDYPTNTPFNGTTRLITPSMDLTGVNNIILTFKHKVNTYANTGYTIGVATRSNGGTWNNVWTMNPADVTEEKSLLISNSDMNQNNVEICFFFSGNSYQINYWYIDDVSLVVAETKDLVMKSISNLPYTAQGNQVINFDVTNMGIDTVTSFDATYSINGSSPITETVSGVNITTTNSYNYSFTTPWNATSAGYYNLSVSISNINGAGDDDNTSNNSLSKNISVATQTSNNLPLYEVFTSSTCGPCAGFNGPIMAPFMSSHSDIAVVKYQMNWPGSGDPYYTAEGGTRKAYYNVIGIPNVFAGGQNYPTSSSGLNNGYATETAKNGFFDIQADFSVNGNNIIIHENIMPYISGNYKIHTAVIEKETTQNASTNGETSFERVMMKMLPDANGVDFNFGANQPYTQTYNFDMSSTNVEEMSDLAVVIFVQDDNTKNILQAKYVDTATLSTDDLALKNIAIYPNPSKGILHIDTNKNIQVSVTDLLGKTVVPTQNFNTNNTIDISNLNNGMYIVKVSNGNTTGSLKIILNK